ncbi:MAG: biotin transporter BioY [Phormidesmis sp.]
MSALFVLLWALIGLILTIGSTWLEAFSLGVPLGDLLRGEQGIWISSLQVSFQVGAALFTGCMGGKTAAALSQIAYVALGILLFNRFGYEVFTQGAGVASLREPWFGYLLGFIPGGWLCGSLAFRAKATLERLAFASLAGLAAVHVCGLSYLLLGSLVRWVRLEGSLGEAIMTYSVLEIPGQVMVACAIALIALGLKHLQTYIDRLLKRL